MKKQLLFITSLFISLQLMAQYGVGVRNNGAKIVIPSGASMKITGGSAADFTNNQGGKVDLNGNLKLEGDWENNSSANPVFVNQNSTGTVLFLGSSNQHIGGTYSTSFENMTLGSNSSGFTLDNDQTVSGSLYLAGGIANLSTHNLTISSINNLTGSFSSSTMFVSGGGNFAFTPVVGVYKTIPLGDISGTTEYSRIYFVLYSATLGSNAQITMRAINGKHPSNSSVTNYLNRYWSISSNDMTNMNARVYAFYTDGDINGTEASIQPGMYNDPFWSQGAYIYTPSNYLRFDNVSTFGDLTGGESSAFTVTLAMSNETTINESSENGETILVTVSNGTFVASPNLSNWQFYNLPDGVTVGSVTYVNSTQVRLTLSGNRTKDYDVNMTDMEVWANYNEINNLNSGSVYSNSGVTFTASNDSESISMADDGLITEGSEGGEIIAVTLTNGTFANPINSGSWTLSNLPGGVGYSITRTGNSTAAITLIGNTTEDYDADITNFTVTIPDTEVDDYTGTDLVMNTGVTFTAIVESLTLTLASDGSITESTENGEVITVTVSGKDYAATLDSTKWTVSNLPVGVSWRSLTRNSISEAQFTLSGNRTIDYDANITNMSVGIQSGQLVGYDSLARVSSGVAFTATNDPESVTLSMNPTTVNEGSENGTIISVDLAGGTFYPSLDIAKWNISNLPQGVTIGSVNYLKADSVTLVLSGNSTIDYDSNIDLNLSVDKSQLADVSASVSGAGQQHLTANNDAESVTMSGSFNEGDEDGGIITVTLSYGTLVSPVNQSDFLLTGLPSGVELSSVNFVDATHLQLVLIGNATTDYDVSIADATLTVQGTAYNDGSSVLSTSTGVTFTATDEPVVATITSDALTEANEDGKKIYLSIVQDTLDPAISSSTCLVHNLPVGVSVGTVARISGTHAEITLTGSRTSDFDNDITDIYIELTSGALVQHSYVVKSDSVTIYASDDNEFLSMNNPTAITEGSENGGVIEVTLTGGTFATSITPSNWQLAGLPNGVLVGTVIRTDDQLVTITLSGDATVDYDTDLYPSLTVPDTEVDDYSGSEFSLTSGVALTSVIEPLSVTIANNGGVPINEGSEDLAEILVTLQNDEFVSSLDPGAWSLTNLPTGVHLGSLNRTDSTHVVIVLSGNRSIDYDQDDDTVSLSIQESQFVHQSVSVTVTSGVVITAITDVESLAFTATNITEKTENSAQIQIDLTGGTFVETLNLSNWVISGQPTGVLLGNVTRVDETTATLTLSGNSTVDYDTDITGFGLTVNADEVDDHPTIDGDFTVAGIVTFKATNEQLVISSQAGQLDESNLNGSEVDLELTGDTFVDFGLDVANFHLNNAPDGVLLSAIQYVDEQHAHVMLGYDGTDFDADYTQVSILVDAVELTSGGDITSNELTINAIIELPFISMTDNGITEGNESSGIITINLFEDIFKSVINPANWQISNLPSGVSVNSITRIDTSTAQITLTGNRTSDYDANMYDFAVTIPSTDLVTGLSEVSSSSGVVFQAIDDAESISFTPKNIQEGNEDGQEILVTLTGGTFVDSFDLNQWTTDNLPVGINLGNVVRESNTTATLVFSGNRTVDYDADITNFKISIESNQVDDMVSGNLSVATGITFVAHNESLTVAPTTLNESTLDGSVATLFLTSDTLKNSQPALSAFTLINAPMGLSVASVNKLSATSAELTFSFDSTDFDQDYKLLIAIDTSELMGVSQLVSDTLTLVTVNDDEVITMFDDNDGIYENSESGEKIIVQIAGGTFANPANFNLWKLQNLPTGVTYSISTASLREVQILLTSNTTVDYDADITNFTVVIPATDVHDYSGNDISVSSGVVFHAYNEALAATASLTESNLDGNTIALSLTEEHFVDNTLSVSNFILNHAPAGLSVASVTYDSPTVATLHLAYNPFDFDTDITNLSVTVNASELSGVADLTSNNLPITAVIENENIVILHSGLTEENLNGAQISLELQNVAFTDNSLSISNFIVNCDLGGLSVSSVQYNSGTTATVSLSYNGLDFDSNYPVNISVLASELSVNSTISSNQLTIQATNDPEIISLVTDGSIVEGNENNQTISVKVAGGDFSPSPDFTRWHFINLPSGVTATNFSRVNDTLVTLQLSGNCDVDFDSDLSVTLEIESGEVLDAAGAVYSSNFFIITTLNDTEVLTMSDDGEILEGAEDGEQITVNLTGGTFRQDYLNSGFNFLNLPIGVSLGTVSWVNSTQVVLSLYGNRTQDYDNNIYARLNVSSNVVDDYSGNDIVLKSGVVFISQHESTDRYALVTPNNLTEQTLSGAVISFAMMNEQFVDNSIDINSFVLINAPAGTGISQVAYLTDTTGTITLSFDGTDFDSDFDQMYFNIGASELVSSQTLSSDDIYVAAVVEPRVLQITASSSLVENTLNGSTVDLTISQDQFADNQLDSSNFVLNNVPLGLIVQSVNYIDSVHAQLVFAFDGTDFDADSTNFSVTLMGSELLSAEPVASNSMTISAIDELKVLTISTQNPITEEILNGLVVDLIIENDSLADASLDSASFVLIGVPQGLVVNSVTYVSAHEATLTLAFGGIDFDSDYPSFKVLIDGSELASGLSLTSNALNIAAVNDEELITLSTDQAVSEGAEGGIIIHSILTGGTYIASQDVAKWTFSNLPMGVTVDSIHLLSLTQVDITLKGNTTEDYDSDLMVGLSLDETQVDDYQGNALISQNQVPFVAIVEQGELQITNESLNEFNLNGAVINFNLINAKVNQVTKGYSGITLNNAPAGLDIQSVTYTTDSTGTIQLMYDGSDFDVDFNQFNLTFDASILNPAQTLISNSLAIAASIEPVAIIAYDGTILEGQENGEPIFISLSQGTFSDIIQPSDIEISGLPEGINLTNLQRVSDTSLVVHLTGNRIFDYDTDIALSQVILKAGIFNHYYGNDLSVAADILLTARNEQLTISHPGLTEANLNGAQLELQLSDDWFVVATINPDSIILHNAPNGASIQSVQLTDSAYAILTLAFDGTDFTSTIEDFFIEVVKNELFSGQQLESNLLTIQEGTSIIDGANAFDVDIFAEHSTVVVNLNRLPVVWTSAYVGIYDVNGKRIYFADLMRIKQNRITLNAKTANYFVKATINGKVFVNKVFIMPE